tara:strand:+ start:214 stop:1089 length:876 start_codon:yes stop_codon:yes gene_type:complete
MIIKLRDSAVAHDPLFFKNTKNIIYSREPVRDGDVVLYTNGHFHEYHANAKMKIAVLMDTREVQGEAYNYIANNYNKYDLVFTNIKELLDLNNVIIKEAKCLGPSWLHDDYIKIYKKTKICSMISSSKSFLAGHKLRLEVMEYVNKNYPIIDLFGNNFIELKRAETGNPRCKSNGKINGLKNYMFSIVMENCYHDYDFTEKIIDSFLSGTIPIYRGCPSIYKYFNINGILTFNTLDELVNILNNLSENKYNDMYEYVQENFNKAQNYKNFTLNDDVILDYYKKKEEQQKEE